MGAMLQLFIEDIMELFMTLIIAFGVPVLWWLFTRPRSPHEQRKTLQK